MLEHQSKEKKKEKQKGLDHDEMEDSVSCPSAIWDLIKQTDLSKKKNV